MKATASVSKVLILQRISTVYTTLNNRYKNDIADLLNEALLECSLFSFRRTEKRAQQFIDSDLRLGLKKDRIDNKFNQLIGYLNDIKLLCDTTQDDLIIIDTDMAWLLFDN